MSYDKVTQAKKITVGLKQTMKAMERQQVDEVFIALDSDPRMVQTMIQACNKLKVPYIEVNSMKQLGKACNIEVGTAVAGLLKESI